MEYCLTCCRPAAGLWGAWRRLLQTAVRRALSRFAADDREETRREVSRRVLNQRAEQILNTYGNSILRYAYSYLHNKSDAEEVLQDTLVKFLQTAPTFGTARHEKACLMRAAGNLSKNRLDYNRIRVADELS